MFKPPDQQNPKLNLSAWTWCVVHQWFRIQLNILHNVLHMDLWEIMVYRRQPDLTFFFCSLYHNEFIINFNSGITLPSPSGANVFMPGMKMWFKIAYALTNWDSLSDLEGACCHLYSHLQSLPSYQDASSSIASDTPGSDVVWPVVYVSH